MENPNSGFLIISLIFLWLINIIVGKYSFIQEYNILNYFSQFITIVVPVYFFIFRVRNAFLTKSLKSINDLLIKTNEKCIDVFLDENPSENITDIKKVTLYLSYISFEIKNFPYGGPITSFFLKLKYFKKYEQDAMRLFSNYQELITYDTIIENKSQVMSKEDAEILIDKIIHASTELSNTFETHLRKYI